jgi:hypothetical protein
MVILNKMRRQTERLELVFAVGFHEEAGAILKNVRHQHNYAVQNLGFNFDIHVSYAFSNIA